MARNLLILILSFLSALSICAADITKSEKEIVTQFQASFVERFAAAIQADDVTAMAWSAHLAGRHGIKEAVPLLRKLMAKEPQEDDKKRRFLALAVVDALVQLDAHVSDEELSHALDYSCQSAAIALAARDPQKHQAFLRRLLDQTLSDTAWTAVGNLLLDVKSPLLAEPLIGVLEVELHVQVREEGSDRRGGGQRRTVANGDGTMTAPEKFPPTAFYKLVEAPRRGDVVVAPGSRTIYLSRTERAESVFGVGSQETQRNRNEDIAGYLAGLLDRAPLSTKVRHSIYWSTPEAYLAEVTSERKEMQEAWRSLTADLHANKLLPESISIDVVQIKVTVEDHRSDKAKPIPPIAE